MTVIGHARQLEDGTPWRALSGRMSPALARAVFVVAIATAVSLSLYATGQDSAAAAIANAGDDLTRLLRMMAAVKAVMAVGALAVIWWRLASGIAVAGFVAYATAAGAMAAGPGLTWAMAHVGMGALLLHGGLLACVVLLWRDPAVAVRMQAALDRRRAQRRRQA